MYLDNFPALTVCTLPVGQMQANCFVVADKETGQAIIIDPGDDPEYIENTLIKLSLKPVSIYATHGHFDHIMAGCALQLAYDIPFFIHKNDLFLVDDMQNSAKFFLHLPIVDPPPLVDKGSLPDHFSVSKVKIRSINVPGHTPGSVCFHISSENILFSGDLIFADGAVGRTDFSYSSKAQIDKSLKSLKKLPADTIVFPGHGEKFRLSSLRI